MLDGTRVTGVIVESKSGRQAIAADIVIDCMGDGNVAEGAGAPFMSPDESGKTDRMQMSCRCSAWYSRRCGWEKSCHSCI